jgi:hypothetical protein
MCRKSFNEQKYKITVRIDNTDTCTSNTLSIMAGMEIRFNVELVSELESILEDLNIRLSDVDPLVLDAE